MTIVTKKMKKELITFSFLIPSLVFFSMFVVVPFVQGIPIAFTEWDGFSNDKTAVGFANFLRIFTDKSILNALANTFKFAFTTVIGSNGIGLLLAVILVRSTRGNNIARTMIFMPFIISLVLSAIIWSYIYSDVLYRYLGILSPLGSSTYVMFGLAVISIWRDAGYCMIIYIAALNAVPEEFYEAAHLEGAGTVKRFYYITMPMIGPAITANVTLVLSWGLKVFDYPMTATQGGPGRSSETLAIYAYNNIFQFYKAGYGQAFAIVMMIFIFIFSSLTAMSLRKREVEL